MIGMIMLAGIAVSAVAFLAVFLAVRMRGSSEATPVAEAVEPGSGTVIISALDDAGELSQLAVLVPEAGGGFSLYTIPPRTIAETPGQGFREISKVAGLGGQELLDQTVANLLQVPIQYHIQLSYPVLEIAAEQAGTVNFRTDQPLAFTSASEAVSLSAGDNPVSAQRAAAFLKAAVDDGRAGPRLQALFYQGLRESLALKGESDRRALAQLLYKRLQTDLDEGDFTGLFLAVTTQARPFGAWPLPVRLAGVGNDWYLEPVPSEVVALMTGSTQDSSITLEVRNGTEAAGVVEAAAAKLAPLRYTATLQPDPSGVDFDTSQIRCGSEALAEGNRVRELLGKGTIIKDEYMEKRQIIVIIGRDLTLADLETR